MIFNVKINIIFFCKDIHKNSEKWKKFDPYL